MLENDNVNDDNILLRKDVLIRVAERCFDKGRKVYSVFRVVRAVGSVLSN